MQSRYPVSILQNNLAAFHKYSSKKKKNEQKVNFDLSTPAAASILCVMKRYVFQQKGQIDIKRHNNSGT